MVSFKARALAAGLALATFAAPAPLLAAPYVIAGSDTFAMTSQAGAHYRVHVQVPERPAPPGGFAVLYLLDGDMTFASAVETAQRLARFGRDEGQSEGIVVAIGYPDGDDMLARRSFDYTPEGPPDAVAHPTGGAPVFRRFLAGELMPRIASSYRIDTARQTLWGHSFGALFVLDTLLGQPELFRNYVATSPSLWFGARSLEGGLGGLPARLAVAGPRTLHLGVGEREQDSVRARSQAMAMTHRELADRLAAVANLEVHSRVYSGESHGGTLLPGLGQAVRVAFQEARP
ncbi:alpha/beta hydrolase [Novosphingobium mangrovi (ex Hu et al. 2023)]|uniref:Alpha/beta hydrolase-fold protein n=1 Tax=Novosphingobium mangrovi (ex Hu et al. 2023) TaxID=2930094 RepID=A0ABT0AAH2_9SPHN|nr:alpha/beta hydrolase-fold protein [Novosphingobium mangrovi (ex Hu et al. 2023)]MCJ1960192.1 alpha/beta hydrolase-fold protein [Novosphingobium mangrovi (ex Hu et al. 2023)]